MFFSSQEVLYAIKHILFRLYAVYHATLAENLNVIMVICCFRIHCYYRMCHDIFNDRCVFRYNILLLSCMPTQSHNTFFSAPDANCTYVIYSLILLSHELQTLLYVVLGQQSVANGYIYSCISTIGWRCTK